MGKQIEINEVINTKLSDQEILIAYIYKKRRRTYKDITLR